MTTFNSQNQVKDSTTAATLPDVPKQQAVNQDYLTMCKAFPQPSQAALTPLGMTDDSGKIIQPVDNSYNQPVQASNNQNQPVDNFQQVTKQYDLRSYNTANPQYFKILGQIYDSLPDFKDTKAADNYIQTKFKGSKINAQMFVNASNASGTNPRLLAAFAQYESHFGLSPRSIKYNNATGYGALDNGQTRSYKDFQENLNHTAAHLALLKN